MNAQSVHDDSLRASRPLPSVTEEWSTADKMHACVTIAGLRGLLNAIQESGRGSECVRITIAELDGVLGRLTKA